MPLVTFQIASDQIETLRSRLTQSATNSRQQFVHDVTAAVAAEVARTVPIDTGETQRAWEAEVQRIASAVPVNVGETSSLSASVDVEQMRYIEYGTSRMIARAPVRRAIEAISSSLNVLFRWI